MKEAVFTEIDALKNAAVSMADRIFDHPEVGTEEVFASSLLTEFLKENGFEVETGTGGCPTAFRAEYQVGEGGPSIGFLCEYDALKGMGHGCAHHMQGPAVCAAVTALKRKLTGDGYACKIIVYGTPNEEGSGHGGKVIMSENGCFRDIDVALIIHGGARTQSDRHSLARYEAKIRFVSEEKRHAEQATLLCFEAVEYMREHVPDDARMHYCINSLSEKECVATFELRSKSNGTLKNLTEWFEEILQGAKLMTNADYECIDSSRYYARFAVEVLHELFMENALISGAKRVSEPRAKTGSSDFGHVMQIVPGISMRVAFLQGDFGGHSQAWLDAGKSEDMHDAISAAAKIMAGLSVDLIEDPKKIERMKKEYVEARARAAAN